MTKSGNKFSNVKERILYILEIKGIVKESFFKKIGMTYGNFTGKAKETPLNSTALGNILLEIPDANPDWLILGVGSMLRDETPLPDETITEEDSLTKILSRYEALVRENENLRKENEKLKTINN